MAENQQSKGHLEDQLASLTKSIDSHESTLKELQGVPKLLKQIAQSVGINSAEYQHEYSSGFSLGLNEENDDYSSEKELENLLTDITNPLEDNSGSNELADDAAVTAILADVEETIEFGPELLPKIAEGFKAPVSRTLSKDNFNKIKDTVKVPLSCKAFVVPKMNSELWSHLPAGPRLFDLKQQQVQQTLSLGLIFFAKIANEVAQKPEEISDELKATVLKFSIDGANLLGQMFQEISVKRRSEVRRHIQPEYQGICSSQVPVSEFLFGNDLSESLKASKAASSVIRKTFLRDIRPKPYARPSGSYAPLNSYRPFQQQWKRGNGQFRGRGGFQGHNRPSMLNPSHSQSFNQRFQKPQ